MADAGPFEFQTTPFSVRAFWRNHEPAEYTNTRIKPGNQHLTVPLSPCFRINQRRLVSQSLGRPLSHNSQPIEQNQYVPVDAVATGLKDGAIMASRKVEISCGKQPFAFPPSASPVPTLFFRVFCQPPRPHFSDCFDKARQTLIELL